MTRKSLNNAGFGLVEGLIIIVVMLAVVAGAAYVYHWDHKAKTTTAAVTSSTRANKGSARSKEKPVTSSTNVVSSTDGKVQISLPTSWEITGSREGTQVIDALSSPNCFTSTDPNPCIYSTYFAPRSYSTMQLWTLSVERTTRTAQQVIESIVGRPQASDTIAQSSSSINGYGAYYIQYKSPNTSIYYAVAYNGYVVLFQNGQLSDQADSNQTLNSASSPFLTDFKDIVYSIKLDL